MLSKVRNYYHTIKYLKLTQIYGQLLFRLKKPTVKITSVPKQRTQISRWIVPVVKKSHGYDGTKITFLNQEKDISSALIWTDSEIDKLWIYNLHYFDVLAENNNSVENTKFIERWINENELGKGCGWEPYPISLRIVNWVKWLLAGNQSTAAMLQSLATQARFLTKRIEIHLLGNHILANAKALLFAGLYFDGKEADRWYQKGLRIFNRELKRQILSDGGHFELSPMYHHTILEDLLDVINLLTCYGKKIPEGWIEKSKKMFFWAHAMCHPDQQLAFFNDAALGVAPTISELNEYQKSLNLSTEEFSYKSLTYFIESGYCRIEKGNKVLLIDIAEVGATYQPGHAHADTFSFELSAGKQRIFVNSGTSCYAESQQRLQERSTSAHNTLVVNDLNSSEIWKSFRVARRAKVRYVDIKESKEKVFVRACHDGYYHLNKIDHVRTWIMNDNELVVEDQVTGCGNHKISINFHIHPDIRIVQESDQKVSFYDQSSKCIVWLQADHSLQIRDSTYHPEFNLSIANKKIIIESFQLLPAVFKTTIQFIL